MHVRVRIIIGRLASPEHRNCQTTAPAESHTHTRTDEHNPALEGSSFYSGNRLLHEHCGGSGTCSECCALYGDRRRSGNDAAAPAHMACAATRRMRTNSPRTIRRFALRIGARPGPTPLVRARSGQGLSTPHGSLVPPPPRRKRERETDVQSLFCHPAGSPTALGNALKDAAQVQQHAP